MHCLQNFQGKYSRKSIGSPFKMSSTVHKFIWQFQMWTFQELQFYNQIWKSICRPLSQISLFLPKLSFQVSYFYRIKGTLGEWFSSDLPLLLPMFKQVFQFHSAQATYDWRPWNWSRFQKVQKIQEVFMLSL